MTVTQIKKGSCSLVVVLPKEFILFQNLKDGDWIDISDVVKIKPPYPIVKKKKKKPVRRKKNDL